MRGLASALLLFLIGNVSSLAFHPPTLTDRNFRRSAWALSSVAEDKASQTVPNYNTVYVPKIGGRGVTSPADRTNPLSLGAPPPVRPNGGHYLTKGGIQVTANVTPIPYALDNTTKPAPGTSAAAIQSILQKLDCQRGVLLNSSYEFPGRYARWSLGFVNPPLVVEGQVERNEATITALNDRGRVLLPAIEAAMEKLKVCLKQNIFVLLPICQLKH